MNERRIEEEFDGLVQGEAEEIKDDDLDEEDAAEEKTDEEESY